MWFLGLLFFFFFFFPPFNHRQPSEVNTVLHSLTLRYKGLRLRVMCSISPALLKLWYHWMIPFWNKGMGQASGSRIEWMISSAWQSFLQKMSHTMLLPDTSPVASRGILSWTDFLSKVWLCFDIPNHTWRTVTSDSTGLQARWDGSSVVFTVWPAQSTRHHRVSTWHVWMKGEKEQMRRALAFTSRDYLSSQSHY